MRVILTGAMILASVGVAAAQEAVSREEALKAAFAACRDLPQMLATPIPTDPDVKRPIAIHADNRGVMILPESKLCVAGLAKAGSEVVPLGQLWMLKTVPVVAGQPIKSDKLKFVTIGDLSVALCALGVHRTADGKLELLVYGKDKEPLARATVTESPGKQENPIELSTEQQGDGALLTLKILGKYSASLQAAVCD